jgi:hypothetical protein
MADYTDQERAEVMRQAAEDMRKFGRMSSNTADLLQQAGIGIKNFSQTVRAQTEAAADALGQLSKSVYRGEQGASVFSSSIEAAGSAVKTFGFLMGGPLTKALTTAIYGLTKAFSLAAENTDRVFDAYNNLAQVGVSAGDQLSGLRGSAQSLQYVVNDNVEGMKQFESLMTANADALALFKGTAFEGRQALALVGKEFDEYRNDFRKQGINVEAQNKGLVNYIRLQSTLGTAQTMTNKQLADGAARYIDQISTLSKLTGQQAEEIESQMHAALQEQRFRAKIDELNASGQTELAKEYQAISVMLAKDAPEAAAGFRAMVTGTLDNVEAQKLMRSTSGEAMRSLDALNKGQIDGAQLVQNVGKAFGQTNKTFNKTAQVSDDFNQSFINYAQAANLAARSQTDVGRAYDAAKTQTELQTGATEGELKDQIKIREDQKAAAQSMEGSTQSLIGTVNELNKALASLTKSVTGIVKDLTDTTRDAINRLRSMIGRPPLEEPARNVAPGGRSNQPAAGASPAAGSASAPAASPAAGSSPASTRNMPGTAPAAGSRSELEGLNVKSGAATESPINAKVIAAAKEIQKLFPNAKFTSFNDPVKGRSANSAHNTGSAMDIVVAEDQVQALTKALKDLGSTKVLNEMRAPANRSAAAAWAPHIHAEFARGGIARGPKSGFAAMLHGTEAVIPMQNGQSIPLSLDIKNLAGFDNTMMPNQTILEDLVRNFNTSTDNTKKMPRPDEMAVTPPNAQVDWQGIKDNLSEMVRLLTPVADLVHLQRESNDLTTQLLQYQRA